MIAFAGLLERLTFTSDPSARIALLRRYFASQNDPERGYAMAVLARAVRVPSLRPGVLRDLMLDRCDPALFDWSRDFVGDITETVALMWPVTRGNSPPPALSEILHTTRGELPAAVVTWLDASPADARLALLKLLTGGVRTLVSGTEIRSALAALGGVPLPEVEAVWHGQTPPYLPLFAWLERRGARPALGGFVSFMQPGRAGPGDWLAEPLWQGDRVLLARGRVFSRDADDISSLYPAFRHTDVVLDGVVTREPICLRLTDMLYDGPEDLRGHGFTLRRARLEAWFDRVKPAGMALSPLVPFDHADTGLMLKRADSPYVVGRDHGFWVARRQPPRMVAAVLLYAEGELYTVGLWRDGTLVPVGRAIAAQPDALDAWVRDHTIARYGPVREVEKSLVVSVTFGAVRVAARRKAGVVLEDACIVATLPGAAADDLDALEGGV